MSRRLSNCLNYTGSKFRFIDEINNNLPKDKSLKFLDLFGGGGDVTVNSFYNDVTYNEYNPYVYNFLKLLRDRPYLENVNKIYDLINRYSLNSKNRYSYEVLKRDFNALSPDNDDKYYYMFYLLVCHSNSNMIRFNKKGEFNLPFGERTFNTSLAAKFRYENEMLNKHKPTMLCNDFHDIDFNQYDVIYADPPYTGSDAPYNEGGNWSENDDKALFEKLVDFDKNGGKFLLSNQLVIKGQLNKSLDTFIKSHDHFVVIELNSNYDNCNYQRDSSKETIEVLIKNY